MNHVDCVYIYNRKLEIEVYTNSTLPALSDGLVLESPSHENFTFGILVADSFLESMES